jgi:aryl-alcohol dehydrogenase-like predicted oxidoreductase
METKPFAEFALSRLMLGTVQLGLPYGIANRTGQPSYQEARAILACAYEGGVNCLDTAAIYGSSEEVLGCALAELGIADRMTIVSKVRHMAQGLDAATAAAIVEESVAQSLKRLRLERLPICLFHIEENFAYAEALLRLKERGLVGHVGSSVMTPTATSAIIDTGLADALQIPTGVLDRRFSHPGGGTPAPRAGVIEEAAGHGMAVFVRSIYLQGLLLIPEEDLPLELAAVLPVRRRLEALAAEAGMSLSELAVRYVLSLDGVTCAVVGIETEAQTRQNLAMFARGPLAAELRRAVEAAVPDLPDKILMPSLWSRRMPDVKHQEKPQA